MIILRLARYDVTVSRDIWVIYCPFRHSLCFCSHVVCLFPRGDYFYQWCNRVQGSSRALSFYHSVNQRYSVYDILKIRIMLNHLFSFKALIDLFVLWPFSTYTTPNNYTIFSGLFYFLHFNRSYIYHASIVSV